MVCAVSVPCRALGYAMSMKWVCDIRTCAVSFSSCTRHDFPNELRLCHHLLGDGHYPNRWSFSLFLRLEEGLTIRICRMKNGEVRQKRRREICQTNQVRIFPDFSVPTFRVRSIPLDLTLHSPLVLSCQYKKMIPTKQGHQVL